MICVVKAVFQAVGCAGPATTPDGSCRLSHTYNKSSYLYVTAVFTRVPVTVFSLTFLFPSCSQFFVLPRPLLKHFLTKLYFSFLCSFLRTFLCHIDSLTSPFFRLLLYCNPEFLVWHLFSYDSFPHPLSSSYTTADTSLLTLSFFSNPDLVSLMEVLLYR